ncbi:MAG TPA: nucleotide sugar dehydrogenase [Candidatus Methylomirabilis sp.]|nr:nucleotide sugar dehydrogenase [Candidatus Methylomirabilis sp.]
MSTSPASFVEKARTKNLTVGVIGLGYVGLPLAVGFARAGVRVLGIEVNGSRVQAINRGESHIPDVPSSDLAPQVSTGRLRASTEYRECERTQATVICVPTPFTRMKAPDLSYIEAACRSLAPHVAPGSLVVLQSTTYPGTTEELVRPILETGGRRVGRDFFLAFSPERIDPGNKQYGAQNTPKVVGGIDVASTQAACALFALLVPADQIHRVSGPRAAEMCKLLENIFRSVNIALVNELAKLCNRMGIDIWEVIDAAATKPFGFMPFYPGPGVGGHCIPVDPYYLSWKAREYDFYTKFIELAAEVNSSMPFFTVNRIIESLNRQGKPLLGARVLILGAAFKRDIDDPRNAPALELMRALLTRGAEVSYHDPHVPTVSLDEAHSHGDDPAGRLTSVPLTEQTLASQDCVCLAVAHSAFDIPWVLKHSRLLMDATGATRHYPQARGTVIRL